VCEAREKLRRAVVEVPRIVAAGASGRLGCEPAMPAYFNPATAQTGKAYRPDLLLLADPPARSWWCSASAGSHAVKVVPWGTSRSAACSRETWPTARRPQEEVRFSKRSRALAGVMRSPRGRQNEQHILNYDRKVGIVETLAWASLR